MDKSHFADSIFGISVGRGHGGEAVLSEVASRRQAAAEFLSSPDTVSGNVPIDAEMELAKVSNRPMANPNSLYARHGAVVLDLIDKSLKGCRFDTPL